MQHDPDMSAHTIPMPPAAAAPSASRSLFGLLPGVALLFGIGLLGKLMEFEFSVLRTQHHLLLPQIEYVLWAIILGLVVSNTTSASPPSFAPASPPMSFGSSSASSWSARSFLMQRRAAHRRALASAGRGRTGPVALGDDAAWPHLPPAAQAHQPARHRLLHLRRHRHHGRAGRHRSRRGGHLHRDRRHPHPGRHRAVHLPRHRPSAAHGPAGLRNVGGPCGGQHRRVRRHRRALRAGGGALRHPRQDRALIVHRHCGARLRGLLGLEGAGRTRRPTRAASSGRSSPSSSSASSPSPSSRPRASSLAGSSPASPTSRAGPSFPPSPASACAPTCTTSSARDGVRWSSASSAKSSSPSSPSASSTGATATEFPDDLLGLSSRTRQ
jgi:hypothetical protein